MTMNKGFSIVIQLLVAMHMAETVSYLCTTDKKTNKVETCKLTTTSI